MMDFAGTEPWLRTLAFVGILLGAGVLAWWELNRKGSTGVTQLIVAGAALATIPAAIVAPIEDGSALTILGIVSVLGFLVCAAVAVLALRETQQAPVSARAATPPAMATAAAPAAAAQSTRVATYSAVTEARSAPAAENTVALGPQSNVAEIAFLIDYSADGHPYRLGADNRIGRDPGVEIPIEDAASSREHARIKLEDGRFVLYDLGSTNGTRLVRTGRRRRLSSAIPLSDLDVIEIGSSRLVFINVDVARR